MIELGDLDCWHNAGLPHVVGVEVRPVDSLICHGNLSDAPQPGDVVFESLHAGCVNLETRRHFGSTALMGSITEYM